jgi:hypothetical protein
LLNKYQKGLSYSLPVPGPIARSKAPTQFFHVAVSFFFFSRIAVSIFSRCCQ